MKDSFAHPYNPNSVRQIKESMLREIGVDSVEDLFEDISDRIRLKRKRNLPKQSSESKVRKIITTTLSRNNKTASKPRDYRSVDRNSRYHRIFALKAAKEAERVLPIFEKEHPDDDRPRQAIQAIRAWAQRKLELGMTDVRKLSQPGMCRPMPWPFLHMFAKLSPPVRTSLQKSLIFLVCNFFW